jgi:hypothetical protein
MKYVMILWILHVGAEAPQTSPPADIKNLEECISVIKDLEQINPSDIGAIAMGVQCYKGLAPKKPSEQEAKK